MKIALLSNINIEIVKTLLEDVYQVYIPPGYGTWFQEILDRNSGIYQFSPDVVVFIIDANSILRDSKSSSFWEELIAEESKKVISATQNFKDCYSIVSTIDVRRRQIRPLSSSNIERKIECFWNEKIEQLCLNERQMGMLDIKNLVEDIGRLNFYDDKMWYKGNIPHSIKASRAIANEITRLVNAHLLRKKKCLVLDLDNTLWGGVVAEDGIDGIVLGGPKEGSRFVDIQQRISELKDTGVLLAVVSKNNQNDVLSVIRSHPNMVLHENDFIRIHANWNKKAENIRDLAQELNIGLDSIVFLDDNPVEREEMKVLLPKVTTIEPQHATAIFENDIIELYKDHFLCEFLTDEDKQKTLEYIGEQKREELRKISLSLEEYLQKLQIKIYIHRALPEEVERIAQLTQKTNQFNLTTRRYSVEEIKALLNDPLTAIYSVKTCDKYGENGLVLVAIIKKKDKIAFIDTFLMSCRVMGRMIEDTVLALIEESLRSEGLSECIGEYLPTGRNTPVADFFERMEIIVHPMSHL